jgi:hypothetical protein
MEKTGREKMRKTVGRGRPTRAGCLHGRPANSSRGTSMAVGESDGGAREAMGGGRRRAQATGESPVRRRHEEGVGRQVRGRGGDANG